MAIPLNRPPRTWIIFRGDIRRPLPDDANDTEIEGFQELLRNLHGARPHPHCDCRIGDRHLEASNRRLATGRHILACMPNEGPLHRLTCAFYRPDSDHSGVAAYVPGMVEEREDGIVVLRLAGSLIIQGTEAAARPPADPPVRPDRPGTARRRAMTSLGLLHLLWERAGLTGWHSGFAGRRQPLVVASRLLSAAEGVQAGRVLLHEQFTAIAPKAWASGRRFVGMAKNTGKNRRVVLVGEVQDIGPQERGFCRVNVAGAFPAFSLFLKGAGERIATLLNAHPYAARLLDQPWEQRVQRVIGLFVVAATITVWKNQEVVDARIEDGAFMETTNSFIPIASDLERQVADRLVAEQRRFSKPLRYDACNDLVLPDFVLLDAGDDRGYPIEVFGRDNEDYRERQEEKTQYYNEVYGLGAWWCWIAAGRQRSEMPPFPAQERA